VTMKRQPEGIRRVRRGDKQPADEYDIFLRDEHLGYTQRAKGGKWRAFPDGQEVWPEALADHTAAVEQLLRARKPGAKAPAAATPRRRAKRQEPPAQKPAGVTGVADAPAADAEHEQERPAVPGAVFSSPDTPPAAQAVPAAPVAPVVQLPVAADDPFADVDPFDRGTGGVMASASAAELFESDEDYDPFAAQA
jgi:hypothetical protein